MRLRQPHTDQPILSARGFAQSGPANTKSDQTEGDDIAAARTFCVVAGTEMTSIIKAERPSGSVAEEARNGLAKGRDPVWLCERLTLIQREAKRARARAIYRSAQDVLSLIQRRNAHMPIDWTRVDGRLFVLNKLLGQYEEGLADLDSSAALNAETQIESEEVLTSGDPVDMAPVSFDPIHELAKETLVDLLPHASDAERDALKRLVDVDLSPAIIDKADEATVAASTIDLMSPESKTESESHLNTTSANGAQIEWIMSDLVQRLLCVGRDYGKVLSVSHSLENIHIADGALSDVDARLFERLSEVITGSLPLQGVGRLNIDPSPEGLIITGSGFETFTIPLPERIYSENEVPLAPPSPRITDDTEADLRAQLAALMDGNA